MKKIFSSAFSFFVVSAVSLFLSCEAMAGSIVLNKVRVDLSKDSPVDTLTLQNTSDEIANLQIKPMRWTQENGEDVYEKSDKILVSPPLLKIQSSKSQVLRIVSKSFDANKELAFRVYVEDIMPKTQKPGVVQVKMRLGVPVYVAPLNPVVNATWKLQNSTGRNARVEVKNNGNVHIQFNSVTLADPANGENVGTYATSFVVLPGQTKVLNIETSKSLKNFKVQGQTDANNTLSGEV